MSLRYRAASDTGTASGPRIICQHHDRSRFIDARAHRSPGGSALVAAFRPGSRACAIPMNTAGLERCAQSPARKSAGWGPGSGTPRPVDRGDRSGARDRIRPRVGVRIEARRGRAMAKLIGTRRRRPLLHGRRRGHRAGASAPGGGRLGAEALGRPLPAGVALYGSLGSLLGALSRVLRTRRYP